MIHATGIVHINHNDNPGINYDTYTRKVVSIIPYETINECKGRVMSKGIKVDDSIHPIICKVIANVKLTKSEEMQIRSTIDKVWAESYKVYEADKAGKR
jgi:hypothetical protein